MIITADFETFWAKDYTLKIMTTEAYVRDPRFKCHGVALKFDDQPAVWHPPSMLMYDVKLRELISRSAMLAHHAQFDGLILSHHFDLRPALWLDTLSMARIALPHHKHSLHHLSLTFGLPGKMAQNLVNTQGKTDLTFDEMRDLGVMSCDDADKTYKIFHFIKDYIPSAEFHVIDMTIRMFTEPQLALDREKLSVYHAEEVRTKQDALTELGLTKKDLGQDDKVAEAYRALGVEPDQKTTAKGNVKFAFAKTDQFMRDMLEDEDERVVALTEARLGVKSTLNTTRCERLLGMHSRGALPVYLRWCGAQPTRWSGGDSMNWQNFPRNEKDGRPGEIRGSILAPPRHKIIVADESQVEARVLAWLAGQHDLVEKFRKGEDPYVDSASQFYGFQVTKANKPERGLGKLMILSAGYGSSGPAIVETAKRGTYGPPVFLTQEEGERAKNIYRHSNRAITRMWWETAEHALQVLEAKTEFTWGPMTVADGAIWLPNGLPMWYTHFRHDGDDTFVLIRGRWRKMWGTKLVQHVCEGLARTILSEAAVRILNATGRRPVNCTHDELMYVVPLDHTDMLSYTLSELKREPRWAPGLPLDAEGAEGERYSK